MSQAGSFMSDINDLVTIGTTGFLRDLCLKRLLESIDDSPFGGRVIVADQNKQLPDFYDNFDIEILDLDFDVGASRVKNEVVDNLNTKYMLWFDDDAVFVYETLIGLVERMENNPEFGWISPYLWEIDKGRYETHTGDYMKGGNTILRKILTPQDIDGFCEADSPSQVGLYRTDLFNDVRWPDEVKTRREHTMFALRVKETDWKTGFDPEVAFKHGGCPNPPGYDEFRNRSEKPQKKFREETGFANISFFEGEPKKLIGCGTGRCGTRSLAKLINDCPGWRCGHEHIVTGPLPWNIDIGMAYDQIEWFNNRNRIGNVAYYFLPYIELMLDEVIGLRVVCLKRNREDTVESFMRWMARRWELPRNPWAKRDDERWTYLPTWDITYPKIDIPLEDLEPEDHKRKQIELYWNQYYEQAEWLEDNYPNQFKIFSIDALNEKEKQEKLFDFIGVKNPNFQLGLKLNESK